jgi:hypothetical protein
MPITLNCFRAFFGSNKIPNRSVRVDANFFEGGSPRNADSQVSDADAIGIYPVHTQWTVVDGAEGQGGSSRSWRYPATPSRVFFRYFDGHLQ